MIARHFLILITGCLLCLPLFAQHGKLVKTVKIDTLYVSLQFRDTADIPLQQVLAQKFDSIVSDFNARSLFFKLKTDTPHSQNSIVFVAGPVKYVT